MVMIYIFMFTLYSMAPGPTAEVDKLKEIPMDAKGNFCG